MAEQDVTINDPKAEIRAAVEADRKRREVALPANDSSSAEIPESVMACHAMFAAHAMQAMLSPGKGMITGYDKLAAEAWNVADEMLKEFVNRYGRDQ